MRHRLYRTVSWLLALALAGCGGSGLVTVKGKVTLDGKALTSGTVTFHPSGTGATSYGTLQSDGTFRVQSGTEQGLAPGKYRVTVMAMAASPTPGPGNVEVVPKSLVPAKYTSPGTSGLEYTVPAGGGQFDIALKSP